jgi:fibronectin type 3 domain-containing protein
MTWTVSGNAAWLALSPASGSNSGTVTSSVNLTGLAAGTYSAIITVTASGSTNSPRQIPVSLTLGASTAGNAGATVTWKANSDTDLAGYKVYQGTSSGTYTAPVVTLPKSTTSYAAAGLQTGTTYFFAVTAYDVAGNESTFSPEVSKSIY